jgi:cbb3-type cytochrome oxidase subunit 3
MTVLWFIVAILVVVVWALTLVDVFRRHYSTSKTIAWILLILILPFIGSLIYWAVRKPTRDEAEQEYLAEASMRHDRASRPFDSTGMGP